MGRCGRWIGNVVLRRCGVALKLILDPWRDWSWMDSGIGERVFYAMPVCCIEGRELVADMKAWIVDKLRFLVKEGLDGD
jgi:hypothetical protein